QISRLLSSPYDEVRHLGGLLKDAAQKAAYNVQAESVRALVDEIQAVNPELGEKAAQLLLRPTRVAPTLVKYANPSEYEIKSRKRLRDAAAVCWAGAAKKAAAGGDGVEGGAPEGEGGPPLLSPPCHYSYRQIRERVLGLTEARRNEIIDLGMRHRGPHDELL